MTVRDLLTAAEDYSEVKIIKDGKALFWSDINSLRDIDEYLLDMSVFKYDYEIKSSDLAVRAFYNVILIEVE